jgi:hypothetical protein
MKTLITTTYYTTSTGSARIKAQSANKKIIVGYDYGARCPHLAAAQKLAGEGAKLEEVQASARNGRAFIATK